MIITKSIADCDVVNLIKSIISCRSAQIQPTVNDEAMEAAESRKTQNISITVPKIAFSHHKPEQLVVKIHSGIQITHQDRNVTWEAFFFSLLVRNTLFIWH